MQTTPQSAAAFDVLQTYLGARAVFTNDEFKFIRTMFIPKSLPAGEMVQRGGEVAQYAVFIAKGCLRSYVIDAKGKEHVVLFAPEDWWLADSISLNTQAPSQYFFDAIEDSNVLLITPASHATLINRIPAYSTAFRTGLQKHAAAKDQRIVNSLSTTAEERYLDFMRTYSSIATRVPQWMLASYLGVSPETVSRIRKKLARKSPRR